AEAAPLRGSDPHGPQPPGRLGQGTGLGRSGLGPWSVVGRRLPHIRDHFPGSPAVGFSHPDCHSGRATTDNGRSKNRYNYRVVRLWQEDPDPYLAGGVNLVPLAPLTNVAEESLPELMRRMAERINPEPRERAEKLWIATLILMELRYEEAFAMQ